MINKLYYFQKTTMSLPEFLALERGEITLKEIKANRQLDNFIGKIMANKQLKKALVFLTALGLTFQTFTFYCIGCCRYFKDRLCWKYYSIVIKNSRILGMYNNCK